MFDKISNISSQLWAFIDTVSQEKADESVRTSVTCRRLDDDVDIHPTRNSSENDKIEYLRTFLGYETGLVSR